MTGMTMPQPTWYGAAAGYLCSAAAPEPDRKGAA